MKQEVNRKHASDKWALDDVVMTSEVTHPPKVSSNTQCSASCIDSELSKLHMRMHVQLA